jgi:Na+-transporting NADH:ubiquinone oxidoreductase subunit NqrD
MKLITSLFIALVITGCIILLPAKSFSATDPSPRHHLVEHFHSATDLGRYSLSFELGELG